MSITPILNLKCCYCGTPIHFSRQACQECIAYVVIPRLQREAREKKKKQKIANKVLKKQAEKLSIK